MTNPAEHTIDLVFTQYPLAWWESCGRIQDKAGNLMKPKANYMQRMIGEIWDYCQDARRPFRIMVLKPRQKGASTISVGLCYHHLGTRIGNGYIIGGAHDQGHNLMRIMGRYAENDEWGKARNPCRVLDKSARWRSGSRCLQGTARNPEAGRSGTFQFVLATEVARWAEEGVANAAGVLSGLLKCVPSTMPEAADTAIILESTAQGASGDFYERWQKTITFEEFRDGKDGYIGVFAPWFAFEDSSVAFPDDASREEFLAGMIPDDRDYMDRWSLTPEQMQWRRKVIEEECQRDPDIFEQDYPSTAEGAFLTSGRRRFSRLGIQAMRVEAAIHRPEYGILAQPGGLNGPVMWQDENEAWTAMCWRWEHPKPGYSYLVSLDQAKGASESVGANPDSHGALVLRAGIYDGGRWMPPMVVARLASMGRDGPECRWDGDILEYEVWKLSRYYGNCLIVVEENFDRGVIEALKRRGANLYRREIFNRIEQKRALAYGWNTNTQTRGLLVDSVARAIREVGTEGSGLACYCPWILDEMDAFVVKPSGKAEAMTGKHDDQVVSLGIGLATIGGATRMAASIRQAPKWARDDDEPVKVKARQWS